MNAPTRALALAVLCAAVAACGKGPGTGADASPELASFVPPPHAEPAHLDALLPRISSAADAGPYWHALVSAVDAAEGRLGTDDVRLALDAYFIEGLRRRRLEVTGTLWVPKSLVLRGRRRLAVKGAVLRVDHRLRAEIDNASRMGGHAEASELGRRRILFGWHLLQDWDATSRALGVKVLDAATRQFVALRAVELAAPRREETLDAERLRREAAVFPLDAAGTTALGRALQDPGEPAVTDAALADTDYARAAFPAALDEALRFDPKTPPTYDARAAFLGKAAASADPRVAALGKAYAVLVLEHADAARMEEVSKILPLLENADKAMDAELKKLGL